MAVKGKNKDNKIDKQLDNTSVDFNEKNESTVAASKEKQATPDKVNAGETVEESSKKGKTKSAKTSTKTAVKSSKKTDTKSNKANEKEKFDENALENSQKPKTKSGKADVKENSDENTVENSEKSTAKSSKDNSVGTEVKTSKEEKVAVVENKDKDKKNGLIPEPPKEFVPVKNYEVKSKTPLSTFKTILLIFITIIIAAIFVFVVYNTFNQKISSGVSIKGVDVSKLNASDAKLKIDKYISQNLPEEITVKHGDFEATISISQINAKFDTKTASANAYNVGRDSNFIMNNLYAFSSLFGNESVDIEPNITIDKSQLTKNLEDMSAQLPDKVTQSSYYIEENNLIVTAGNEGYVVDVDASIEAIKAGIADFSSNDPIELVVKLQQPDDIDIESIYNEVHREPKDAYYTTEPFSVFPSEDGIDFAISIDEAKNIVSDKSVNEYTIPIKYITPNVTTNMIGTEAFPDLLSQFSTKYAASNKNRTTNLILAANKINGTVIMPGETFSYNKVVGERTIAAGYREAPIYVSGEVVDGLGGGICQITTTLYNAVVYANLEIVQRSNHQFVPSYVGASRDATVVYGATDFQFKNNRNYPIKLVCSVSGGIASFQIFGMKQDDDVSVEISAYVTGRTNSAIYSEAYKILKKDGVVVGKELLSKDTYKTH